MTILRPSDLQFIIRTSLISRALIFALQFVSNNLIPDHKADAYRNKYSYALENGTNISNFHHYLYKSINGFVKWDGQYFLEISNDGYVSEPHLAFLPLFPLTITATRKLFFKGGIENDGAQFTIDNSLLISSNPNVSTNNLEAYILSAAIGVVLNNLVFFPIACVALYSLTKLVKQSDDKYARDVVWWFCYNPASIFFSACYTESLFAALTFIAMSMIEYRYQCYLEKHEVVSKQRNEKLFEPLSQLDRLVYISLPSLALISLSTATRSNGMITIGFILYQFLLKYTNFIHLDRSNWSLIIYSSAALELFQDLLVIFMGSVIAAAGYISFQIWSYLVFCTRSNQKGRLSFKPDWCDSHFPHPYGYVQSKYWNVGPFRYYETKQLPNFLLALPVSYLVLTAALRKSKELGRTIQGKRQLSYYLQSIVLTIFCGISINVQVTTRLLASSCPVLYWICADTRKQSRRTNSLLKVYFLSYFVIGTVLHTNFYPWT